ncbi:thioredoxin family protein [Enterococcus sp. BWB1-3]|uniref:thioredoxin family protein n=1 Tax=Enterococcus sp. BWB1-3 TaxID=2787713 RepID=UPI0019239DED|nr:thioredoxin family protein [Enterococcus sp. BWB1-3]
MEEVHSFIENNQFAFLYVSQQNCSVCHAVFPKLKALLEAYPQIALGEVDGGEVQQVSLACNIFSDPALLLFIDGKEYLHKSRFV